MRPSAVLAFRFVWVESHRRDWGITAVRLSDVSKSCSVIKQRLRILLTGRTEWVDPETGETEVRYDGLHFAWTIAGIHSYNWRWVRKYGKRDCGCTINPITRRRVLTLWGCPIHCNKDWAD